jgi:hypothetical protein
MRDLEVSRAEINQSPMAKRERAIDLVRAGGNNGATGSRPRCDGALPGLLFVSEFFFLCFSSWITDSRVLSRPDISLQKC